MILLLSPDKFKGSLSATDACKAIARGLSGYNSHIKTVLHPLADGGEGSLDILNNYLSGEKITINVNDPVGRKIKAEYLLDNENAYIELASASGLILLEKEKQNPMFTSTYGTGELILNAINNGARNIFLFVGGSSTNDAGTGILNALGYKFVDGSGNELYPSGENLRKIRNIDDSSLKYNPDNISFYVLCDVDNTLTGTNGAAYVYARQKGASESEIKILDKGLSNFLGIVKNKTGIDISNVRGGGAAGGVAAGLYGLLEAEIKSGIDFIIDVSGFKMHLQKADFVLTGEGKLDSQSLQGKVVGRVSQLAHKYNKPLILFVGKNELQDDDLQKLNPYYIDTIISHSKNMNDAMENSARYLEMMAKNMLRERFS